MEDYYKIRTVDGGHKNSMGQNSEQGIRLLGGSFINAIFLAKVHDQRCLCALEFIEIGYQNFYDLYG